MELYYTHNMTMSPVKNVMRLDARKYDQYRCLRHSSSSPNLKPGSEVRSAGVKVTRGSCEVIAVSWPVCGLGGQHYTCQIETMALISAAAVVVVLVVVTIVVV